MKRILIIDDDIYIGNMIIGDTNTLLTLSGNDKSIRSLAADINQSLKELRKQRLRFEQGDAELKNAITSISHDLRTPLTAISGYLDLLEQEEKSSEVTRYVEIIVNRIDTLKQLADELFKYSIITSPDYDSPKERVSVNAVSCGGFSKPSLLFVCFSKQKPPAQPVESKSLDKRNPPLL